MVTFHICMFNIKVFLFSGSLVAILRVAEEFDKSHLLSPEVASLVDSVKFYYMDGYFLTHGFESALYLSSKSAAAGKVDIINQLARILKLKFKLFT